MKMGHIEKICEPGYSTVIQLLEFRKIVGGLITLKLISNDSLRRV